MGRICGIDPFIIDQALYPEGEKSSEQPLEKIDDEKAEQRCFSQVEIIEKESEE